MVYCDQQSWRYLMKLTKIQKERQIKVLTTIYTQSPISRIDISKQTGITPATVSDITSELINEGLIEEIGEENETKMKSGRKKILLKISNQHSYYIGIELSEKFFSFVLCDNKGMLYEKEVILATDYPNGLTNDIFYEACETFIKNNQSYQPKAIGMALPGHFSKSKQGIQTNNPFWEHFIFDQLPKYFDGPIYFSNNVECMAISERLFNNTPHDDNYSILHVGRGMFCSSIYEGKLYGLTNVVIGEVGHMIVHPDGELCECGKRGCLQTYASESWIIKKSQILYDNSETTYLRQLCNKREDLAIETILKAYQLGDEGIINILHHAIKYLAITLNNLGMVIDSHRIIIHGKLFDEPQLFKLLQEHIDKNVTLLSTEKKQVVTLKPYQEINGAVAATGLCVERMLLN